MKQGYALTYPWLHAEDTHSAVCFLCDGASPTRDVFAFTINQQPFVVRYCLQDDLLFLHPQPGHQYTHDLYNHLSYFTGEEDMYGLEVSDEKSAHVAAIRVQEILGYKPGAKTLLEVGCAYGHTLLEARKRGFLVTDGIEFSQAAVQACQAKHLQVFLGSANDPIHQEFNRKTYDVVATYSVLEHLEHPLRFLERMHHMVAKDGLLITRVPRMSEQGPWLSLVDHFWHFTEASLRVALRRAGFDVIEVFPSGKFVGTVHGGELHSMTAVARKME